MLKSCLSWHHILSPLVITNIPGVSTASLHSLLLPRQGSPITLETHSALTLLEHIIGPISHQQCCLEALQLLNQFEQTKFYPLIDPICLSTYPLVFPGLILTLQACFLFGKLMVGSSLHFTSGLFYSEASKLNFVSLQTWKMSELSQRST